MVLFLEICDEIRRIPHVLEFIYRKKKSETGNVYPQEICVKFCQNEMGRKDGGSDKCCFKFVN